MRAVLRINLLSKQALSKHSTPQKFKRRNVNSFWDNAIIWFTWGELGVTMATSADVSAKQTSQQT